MGNTGSTEFLKYGYNFRNPKLGDIDMSNAKVYIIDTKEKAARLRLSSETILYVGCLGKDLGNPTKQQLSTIQVATESNACFIFDILIYPEGLTLLKRVFESTEMRKVFHDCSVDYSVLKSYGVYLKNVEDTKAAEEVIYPRRNLEISLNYLYERYSGKSMEEKIYSSDSESSDTDPDSKWAFSFLRNHSVTKPEKWVHRPFTEEYVKYAAASVLVLPEIFTMQELMLRDWPAYRNRLEQSQTSQYLRSATSESTRAQPNLLSPGNRLFLRRTWEENVRRLKSLTYGAIIAALIYGLTTGQMTKKYETAPDDEHATLDI